MKLILNNIFFTFPKVLQTHITMSYNKLILIEVSCYMSEPLLELGSDWWQHHSPYPKLMKMARKYLGIVATSV